jgi:hypothetical protein
MSQCYLCDSHNIIRYSVMMIDYLEVNQRLNKSHIVRSNTLKEYTKAK